MLKKKKRLSFTVGCKHSEKGIDVVILVNSHVNNCTLFHGFLFFKVKVRKITFVIKLPLIYRIPGILRFSNFTLLPLLG